MFSYIYIYTHPYSRYFGRREESIYRYFGAKIYTLPGTWTLRDSGNCC